MMATVNDNLATTLQGLGQTETPKAKRDNDNLGQSDFLELMITQLKTQDPFKPMENGDFIAQMAQFSSVTGLAELQQSFDKLAGSLQSNQALQASSLVGRSVIVPSAIGTLPQGGSMAGAIDLPASSGSVALTIKDANGQLMRRLELGTQYAGDVYFSWDGITNSGDPARPGRYYISAEAQIDGETVALETLVSTSVESVTLGRGGQGMTLNLADGNVADFADVREIK
jgi:flagellar basal-body rod modification protein FlgD